MVFVAIFVAVALLTALFALLFHALLSRSDQTACTLEWLDNFSLENYAPMERLLDRADVVFLASQPGYRPEVGQRLMLERRKIFRGYLRLLIGDFNRLLSLGKLMLVYAPEDRPQLAKALWRQQSSFYLGVCRIYCELTLYPLGWSVDVHNLIEALQTMRDQIQLLASQRVAAGQIA